MSFLLSLKAKLWILATAVVGFVGLILRNKYLSSKADKATHRAEVAEAGIRRKQQNEERETELESEWSDWEREAKDSIDEVPDIISKPRDR